ncbi:hypothetical protein MMC28_008150 [Mycoblastus sanguinarius]|nr:hypothetical protein [Mycoblastus sanguinarius]
MKIIAVSTAIILLATLGDAVPSPSSLKARAGEAIAATRQVKPRQSECDATATFYGAGPNPPSFSMTITANGSTFAITDPLSVSDISVIGIVSCAFIGIDGSDVEVNGDGSEVAVGPPQAQVAGTCFSLLEACPG